MWNDFSGLRQEGGAGNSETSQKLRSHLVAALAVLLLLMEVLEEDSYLFLLREIKALLISQLASAAVEYRAENGFPEEHDYPPVQADQGKISTITYAFTSQGLTGNSLGPIEEGTGMISHVIVKYTLIVFDPCSSTN